MLIPVQLISLIVVLLLTNR